MPKVIEFRKFVYTSASLNANKYWGVKLYDNDDVETEWGKITDQLGLQRKVFSSAGRSFMEKKIKEKTKPSTHYDGGCYQELETLDAPTCSGKAASASTTELKKLATKQIASCPLTTKLVEFFTEVNAHNIYKATGGKIKYDTTAGTFKTPLGIVTKGNIDRARLKLNDIGDFVHKNKMKDPKFVKTLEEYLMLIPQDVSRKFNPISFMGSQTAVQNQNTLLDGLDASYAAVIASAQTPDGKKKDSNDTEPQIFNVKMNVLDDKEEFERISKLFNKTRQDIHYHVRGKKLVRVYSVNIQHMNTAYEGHGSKMTNIWELWHGTKPSNILSILKGGYVIPPSSASFVCGRAFGDGVYFSDQSTKSLQYATSAWSGKDEGKYFMFLNDVAMGNYYLATSSFSGGCKKGYDSTFAKAGSAVSNNEMIVYSLNQIRPKYLCEFSG